jgi:biotin transport system substrate-specific component
MVGLILGPETAFAALVLYLAEGAAGLPVFSPVGPGGIAQLLGRTGGYLFAYPLAATLAAALSRILVKRTSRYLAGFTAAFAASTLIMTSGTVWLAVFLHLSARMAFALGTAPFLPGQAVKILFAAAIFASLGRWRRA